MVVFYDNTAKAAHETDAEARDMVDVIVTDGDIRGADAEEGDTLGVFFVNTDVVDVIPADKVAGGPGPGADDRFVVLGLLVPVTGSGNIA